MKVTFEYFSIESAPKDRNILVWDSYREQWDEVRWQDGPHWGPLKGSPGRWRSVYDDDEVMSFYEFKAIYWTEIASLAPPSMVVTSE